MCYVYFTLYNAPLELFSLSPVVMSYNGWFFRSRIKTSLSQNSHIVEWNDICFNLQGAMQSPPFFLQLARKTHITIKQNGINKISCEIRCFVKYKKEGQIKKEPFVVSPSFFALILLRMIFLWH